MGDTVGMITGKAIYTDHRKPKRVRMPWDVEVGDELAFGIVVERIEINIRSGFTMWTFHGNPERIHNKMSYFGKTWTLPAENVAIYN